VGFVVAAVVCDGDVVPVALRVVAVPVATEVVVSPDEVVSAASPLPEDVELHAPISTNETTRAPTRTRRFDMGRA
jgi:hypothetical protein